METLLRNNFTNHYGLPISTTHNISLSTNAKYFEIEDDVHGETQLHTVAGSSMAIYRNPNSYNITIINYDKFVTGLPHPFQHGKKRCDLVVYSNNNEYFLLNELKDRNPNGNFRTKATKQLLVSLTLIMAVPNIKIFVNGHAVAFPFLRRS